MTGNCPARFLCVFINVPFYQQFIIFFLTANSELFYWWFKSTVVPNHTKTPNTQELSSYSQRRWCLCFIFPCYQNKQRANLLHRQSPILTCLSEGLLIFHNWFACFHPVLRDKYLLLSLKSNIYEKHTYHWKTTGWVSCSVIRIVWGPLLVFVKEVSAWFICHVGEAFPPALAW